MYWNIGICSQPCIAKTEIRHAYPSLDNSDLYNTASIFISIYIVYCHYYISDLFCFSPFFSKCLPSLLCVFVSVEWFSMYFIFVYGYLNLITHFLPLNDETKLKGETKSNLIAANGCYKNNYAVLCRRKDYSILNYLR